MRRLIGARHCMRADLALRNARSGATERQPQPRRFRRAVRLAAAAGIQCGALLLSLRHRHDQGRGRQHRQPLAGRSRQPRAHGRGADRVVCEQGEGAGWQLRRDGGAALRQRVARGAGLPARPGHRHRHRRHAGAPARPRLAHQAGRRRRRVSALRPDGPVRAGRQRQPRERHVVVRAVRGDDRLLRRKALR